MTAGQQTGQQAGQQTRRRQGTQRTPAPAGSGGRVRRLALLALAGTVVIVALIATATLTRSTPATVAACTAGAATGLAPGQCAPDFTLPDVRGRRVGLSAFRGRPVLLHFWAVACTSCRAEYPDFARAVRAYAPRGLAVVAPDAWGEPAPMIQGWQDAHHLRATLLVDPSTAVAALYHGTGTPTTYFIDRSGHVTAGYTGPLPYAVYQQNISRIM